MTYQNNSTLSPEILEEISDQRRSVAAEIKFMDVIKNYEDFVSSRRILIFSTVKIMPSKNFRGDISQRSEKTMPDVEDEIWLDKWKNIALNVPAPMNKGISLSKFIS